MFAIGVEQIIRLTKDGIEKDIKINELQNELIKAQRAGIEKDVKINKLENDNHLYRQRLLDQCVAGTRPTEVTATEIAAVRTLTDMHYTYACGERWKPPLGAKPDFNLIDHWRGKAVEWERRYHELSERQPKTVGYSLRAHDAALKSLQVDTYFSHDAGVAIARAIDVYFHNT